jgi:hypothetical protein
VIDIGPGTFEQNVDTSDPADEGLMIRGTLGSGGSRQTTISGEGSGASNCMFICVVQLGASFPGRIEVKLHDVEVDNTGTDDPANVEPINVEGGSDLRNVRASAPREFQQAIVDLCDDPGTAINRSEIDARGTSGMGIFSGSGAQIRDTEIHSDQAPAILQDLGSGSDSRPYRIRRSWISSAPDSGNYVLNLTSDLTLDSLLVTGGNIGVGNVAFDDASGRSTTRPSMRRSQGSRIPAPTCTRWSSARSARRTSTPRSTARSSSRTSRCSSTAMTGRAR